MPDDVIMALVGRGAEAGEKLLGFQWDPHRVIRYRIAMSRLTEVLEGLEHAWAGRDYAGLVQDYPMSGAPASSYLDGVGWRKKDLAATKALLDLVDGWHAEDWPACARTDRHLRR